MKLFPLQSFGWIFAYLQAGAANLAFFRSIRPRHAAAPKQAPSETELPQQQLSASSQSFVASSSPAPSPQHQPPLSTPPLTPSPLNQLSTSTISIKPYSPSPSAQRPPTTAMATEATLRQTLQSLTTADPTSSKTAQLLSTAKRQLMQLDALIPSSSTPPTLLPLARATLEAGALLSIAAQDPDAFTRYYLQLAPFYTLPASAFQPPAAAKENQRSKLTGLYLLLLLTKGDYAGFHTLLEGLETESAEAGKGLESDKFIWYPMMLEQALMEGAYDRVWKATKGEDVPSKEFGVFTEVLIGTIRAEIASCSEKAYPSVPVVNAKNLLFLESEGGVIKFAKERGWTVKEGRIFFPAPGQESLRSDKDILLASGTVIENTIGYARELETIV